MRLLLDTHIVLWRLTDDPRLPAHAVHVMDNDALSIAVSAISIWEVSVKWALRKGRIGDMTVSGGGFLHELERAGIPLLPVLPVHAAAVDELPPHHGDPFDRFLIATARHEGMVLLTHDRILGEYGNAVLVV